MSNLTDLLPAGAGGKQVDFVASGTLGSGVTVALKTDGTVEAVAGNAAGVGSPTNFTSGGSRITTSPYDSNAGKILVVYPNPDASNYLYGVVGTVSGLGITFGTPVVIVSQGTNSGGVVLVFDSTNNKFVVFHTRSATPASTFTNVLTVSGSSFSVGALSGTGYNMGNNISAVFNPSVGKIFLAYARASTYYGYASIGTVSGTTVSFSTELQFESDYTAVLTPVYDVNADKIVLSYRLYTTATNSYAFKSTVFTMTSTTLTVGASTIISNANAQIVTSVYDINAQKVVTFWRDYLNSSFSTAIVGTVSGTSISYGAPVVFYSAVGASHSAVYNAAVGRIIIYYTLAYDAVAPTSLNGTLIEGTVSGTSITFGTPITFNNTICRNGQLSYDSVEQRVVVPIPTDDYAAGKAYVYASAASNNTSFIGITDQAIADGASGKVVVQGGVSEKVTSLTANTDYYVQADGSISATVSTVPAGKALSATSILLKG